MLALAVSLSLKQIEPVVSIEKEREREKQQKYNNKKRTWLENLKKSKIKEEEYFIKELWDLNRNRKMGFRYLLEKNTKKSVSSWDIKGFWETNFVLFFFLFLRGDQKRSDQNQLPYSSKFVNLKSSRSPLSSSIYNLMIGI